MFRAKGGGGDVSDTTQTNGLCPRALRPGRSRMACLAISIPVHTSAGGEIASRWTGHTTEALLGRDNQMNKAIQVAQGLEVPAAFG